MFYKRPSKHIVYPNHREYTFQMKSKWFHLKNEVIKARLKGVSIREVEKRFGIPKSTLSGWFKNLELAEELKEKLKKRRLRDLVKARKSAVVWHNAQKRDRLKKAKEEANKVFLKIDLGSKIILELALSMLYLGEGSKSNATAIGNSNPLILKFFIEALKELYNFDVSKIKCELHLRADQDIDDAKKYWSRKLEISLKNFTSVSVDKRTQGSMTYPSYRGVCILQCGNIAIQRRLVYLSQIFCEEIADKRAVSSVGRASA